MAVPRPRADPRADGVQLVGKPHALQVPNAVRGEQHSGAHLAESRCLLVNSHLDPGLHQRVRGA